MAVSCFLHSSRNHAVLQVMHVLKTLFGRPLSSDCVIRTAGLRSLRQRFSKVSAMANKKAYLVALGKADSPEFKALDDLPPTVEVMSVNLIDQVLELSDEALAKVDILLDTGFGVRTDRRRAIEKLWPKIPSLKWMHVASAGITHILTDDLVKGDVILTNAKGAFSHSLAEYAMAAFLHFAKKIPALEAQQKAHVWKLVTVEELRGQRLGVIGYGDIGKETARLARAFGMTIGALRRRTERSKEEEAHGLKVYHPEQLTELMADSDFVVAALPATPATDKFITEEAIAAMKPNAVFVNLGRGTTVDEAALTEALKEKRIRGAALDVFEEEPLPESSPLWDLDNVLISPHSADNTATFLVEAIEQFVGNAKRYVEGQPLINICDKEAGY